MRERGVLNVPVRELSQEYDCHRTTIYKDIEIILKDNENLPKALDVAYDLKEDYNDNVEDLREIAREPSFPHGNRIKAMKEMRKQIESYTSFLEDYGLKFKQAEKHEVTGDAYEPVPIQVITPTEQKDEEEGDDDE